MAGAGGFQGDGKMQLWDKASSGQMAGGLEFQVPADSTRHEEKRQRALQFLGERWLLHRANAPARRRQLLNELALENAPDDAQGVPDAPVLDAATPAGASPGPDDVISG
jgi:hypothetical protein